VPTIINFPQKWQTGLHLLEWTRSKVVTNAFFFHFNVETVSRVRSYVCHLGCRLNDRRNLGSNPSRSISVQTGIVVYWAFHPMHITDSWPTVQRPEQESDRWNKRHPGYKYTASYVVMFWHLIANMNRVELNLVIASWKRLMCRYKPVSLYPRSRILWLTFRRRNFLLNFSTPCV